MQQVVYNECTNRTFCLTNSRAYATNTLVERIDKRLTQFSRVRYVQETEVFQFSNQTAATTEYHYDRVIIG
jgi:hypothetical protein